MTRIAIECMGIGSALGFTARSERCRCSQPLQRAIVAARYPAAALVLLDPQQSELRPLDVPACAFTVPLRLVSFIVGRKCRYGIPERLNSGNLTIAVIWG